MRIVAHIVAMLLIVMAAGCSVPDNADIDAIVRQLRQTTVEQRDPITRLVLRGRAADWLGSRSADEKVVTIRCLDAVDSPELFPDEKSPEEKSLTAGDLLDLLLRFPMRTLPELMHAWAQSETGKIEDANDALPAGAPRKECRYFFSKEFEKDGDRFSNWRTVTFEDMAKELAAAPAPPMGIAWGGALEGLLPVLCALNTSWGCPDDPAYPGPALPSSPPAPYEGDSP